MEIDSRKKDDLWFMNITKLYSEAVMYVFRFPHTLIHTRDLFSFLGGEKRAT